METIFFKSIRKLKQNKKILEDRLGVALTISGKQVTIEGESINEYEASQVLDAINFGFELRDALLILNETFVFRKLPIKQFTRRKDLEEVRGRIIGTEGKTRRTIENVSGCAVVVSDNMVGVIGPSEAIEEATTAITNLIRGTKQANVYRFLERMNAARKEKTDLGLKQEKKKQ
jgi:ribosomal RNA assembly protein